MFRNLINAFKNKEIRTKILITIALLFIYRLGCWLPIPGIGVGNLVQEGDSLLSLLSQIGGNALQNGAILALGITPYINASIIVQLLTLAIPVLERWSRQGEDGRKKISKVTKVITLLLAIGQAAGITISWAQVTNGIAPIPFLNATWTAVIVGAVLVAGSMFTMWLGDRITELGVGNGISLIIFVGIISTAGLAIFTAIETIAGGNSAGGNEATMAFWGLFIFLVLVVLIFLFIVFIDLSERKIVVNYAKQIKGRKQYGGQSSNIPIKINANGVLPIIFSTAMLTFPQMIARMFTSPENLGSGFYGWWTKWLGTGSYLYFILLGVLIMAFSFFYTTIQFKPDEIARNLQQYGGSIQGFRPGKQTADYLKKVSRRLTFFGALFLMIIAIVPSVIFQALGNAGIISNMNLINAFTATGLLIVVSVALELNKQIEGLLMMKRTRGFLK